MSNRQYIGTCGIINKSRCGETVLTWDTKTDSWMCGYQEKLGKMVEEIAEKPFGCAKKSQKCQNAK